MPKMGKTLTTFKSVVRKNQKPFNNYYKRKWNQIDKMYKNNLNKGSSKYI